MFSWLKNKYALLDERYPKHAKAARFIISGGIAAVIDLLFLYIFTDFIRLWYVLSAIFAFIIAFGASFTLQKYWTFRDRSNEKVAMQGAAYFAVSLINLALNTFLVYFFTDIVSFHYIVSQIIAGALVAIVSYFVYQKFIFNRPASQ